MSINVMLTQKNSWCQSVILSALKNYQYGAEQSILYPVSQGLNTNEKSTYCTQRSYVAFFKSDDKNNQISMEIFKIIQKVALFS